MLYKTKTNELIALKLNIIPVNQFIKKIKVFILDNSYRK